MARLAAGAASKSEKMRRLAAAGYSRQEIADFLGVRYQFVRNVLVEHEKRQGQTQGHAPHAGLAEERRMFETKALAPEHPPAITVGPDGSAVIPAFVLAGAGLLPGDSFVPDVAGEGDVRLLSGNAALQRAQELFRRAFDGSAGLVDELLQERRHDAASFARDAHG